MLKNIFILYFYTVYTGERGMKKQSQNSIVYTESEAENNKYTAELMLVFLFLFYILFMLNEFDFFLVDKLVMRVAFITNFVCVSIIAILALIPQTAESEKTKYAILTLSSVFTLVLMSALNFHAIIVMTVPMVVALSYHSKKISIYALICTVICGGLAPVLGIFLHTWQADFFGVLLYATDPSLASGELSKFVPAILKGVGPYQVAISYIALPQVVYGFMLGIAIIINNKRKRKQYIGQYKRIIASRDSVLVAIADLVENRDLNTGGHIKRTRQVVEILTKTLSEAPEFRDILTEDYCDTIINTAAMHDLGKIAIPDGILNKPGKLTPEEFEIIKTHSTKSCEIVKSVLKGLQDDEFNRIAANIALYHHEKYDGSGYPEGLKGDDIPLEARIMAIADVYDALVSERCYKEPIPHDKAYVIIKESMGSHFDPKLWNSFSKAHRKIMEIYS